MRFIPYCSGSGNWISFVQSGSKRSRKTRWHAVINAGACRGGKQRRLIIRVWGGGMTGGGQGMVECKSVGRRVEDVGVEGWSLRGSKGPSLPFGEGGRGRGVDDVNYGRSKRAVVVAVVVCVDFKKKSAHRGRSACPATRKRDALPPVHRNRTRLPRFAAPPASRCINTTKGGRTDRNRPRTRSRYSKRELLAFIAIIVVVIFFPLDDRSSFRDRSPFVLLVDLY